MTRLDIQIICRYPSVVIQRVQMFIESHAPFDQLATANGATWLDRQLVAEKRERLVSRGFGADAQKALRRRQQWLVQEGLMHEQNGQLIASRRMLAELNRRDMETTGSAVESRLGLKHVDATEFGYSGGQVTQSIRSASGRFAVMQKGKQFALLPWRQTMRMRKGKGFGIEVGKGISR